MRRSRYGVRDSGLQYKLQVFLLPPGRQGPNGLLQQILAGYKLSGGLSAQFTNSGYDNRELASARIEQSGYDRCIFNGNQILVIAKVFYPDTAIAAIFSDHVHPILLDKSKVQIGCDLQRPP